jgi:RNA polymerase sigma-70 factor, ECF subfamily
LLRPLRCSVPGLGGSGLEFTLWRGLLVRYAPALGRADADSAQRVASEPFWASAGSMIQVTIADDTPAAAEAEQLLNRARQGDGAAFCRLAEGHEKRLYQQALALCGHLQTAEDLVAETMVEAWRSLARFDSSCRLSTWLYAILLHRHLKLIRRMSSRPAAATVLPGEAGADNAARLAQLPDSQPSALEGLVQAERAAQLKESIAALPKGHQAVILLRFYQDASLPEIAAALALPLGTVKSRLHHALARLRQMESLMNLHARGGDR